MLRLALALGHASPARMLGAMTSAELTEWMAFYELEPWGADADNYRAGVTPAVVAGMFKKKGDAAAKPLDFFPDLSGDRDGQVKAPKSSADLEHAIRCWNAVMGGEVRSGQHRQAVLPDLG